MALHAVQEIQRLLQRRQSLQRTCLIGSQQSARVLLKVFDSFLPRFAGYRIFRVLCIGQRADFFPMLRQRADMYIYIYICVCVCVCLSMTCTWPRLPFSVPHNRYQDATSSPFPAAAALVNRGSPLPSPRSGHAVSACGLFGAFGQTWYDDGSTSRSLATLCG